MSVVLVAVKAGFAYFGVVFGAGFVLGVLRTLVVIPRVGEQTAVLIELPVILALSWVVARWLVVRFEVRGLGARLVMGAVAFGLTMAGEFGLAVFALGRTVSEHLASFRSGLAVLGLTAQVAFALIPAIQLLASGKPDPRGDGSSGRARG